MKIYLIVVLLFTTPHVFAKVLFREGVARSLKSDALVYREVHAITQNPQGLNELIVTNYYGPKGEAIAKMTSDFTKHFTVPDVQFEDFRFGVRHLQKIAVDKSATDIEIRDRSGVLSAKKIVISDQMVAGQGFDNLIKMNLSSDSKKSVDFLAIDKLDFFKFEVKPSSKIENNLRTFTLQLSSVLLRMLVNPIEVKYEVASGKLVSYKGISNLVDENNEPQNVFISYRDNDGKSEK